jgi:hypothetical protein
MSASCCSDTNCAGPNRNGMFSIRLTLALAILLLSGGAQAGCFTDEKLADLATRVLAYVNACTTVPQYDDNGSVDVFVSLGAVDPSEKANPSCRSMIILQAAQASARLQAAPKDERKAQCERERASSDIQRAIERLINK